MGHHFGSSGIVVDAQRVVGDRDEFGAAVGGAAALSIPARDTGPEYIFLSRDHAHDKGLDGWIWAHGYTLAETDVGAYGAEVVEASPLGRGCPLEQSVQKRLLDCLDIVAPPLRCGHRRLKRVGLLV